MTTERVTSASPLGVCGVRLLGPVALLTRTGEAIELPSATQRRLLALLALEAGRTVRSDAIGDVLELSGGALRKVVSRLRNLVGDALQTSATGYRLDLEVDAARFIGVARAPTRAVGRRARLVEALGWWHGDALDEFAAEPWAMAEATRLETLRAAAVEELADHLIEAGLASDAVALLEPHLVRNPWADPPQVLVVRALAAAGRPTDALRAAHRYRTELNEATGLDPGPEFGRAERRVAEGWDGRGEARPTMGVPAPVTRRFGSDGVLDDIVAALGRDRVVTLTGPGGVGKTRAALEVAARSAERFPDGVVVVELAPLTDAVTVPDAVASSTGVATRAGLSVTASIVERLSGNVQLLVLDNCEHVVGAAADLVRAVVAGCPSVIVLVTSREPLGVRGERVVTVRPLALDDGVELFCERAVAVDADATFDEAERVAIGEICRRLDGLPLAVELAAARARSMAPADLLARLGQRFEVLGSARDGQSHQRTLWATIDWSYRLLDADERLVFDQLAVFHGSFDLAAVERVGAVPGLHAAGVGALLGGLVDKSMVVTERAHGSLRYRLLETIREFAEVRLAERGVEVVTACSRRHLDHYVQLAEAVDRRWFSPEQVAADGEFDREWDNLRAAHSWADTHGEPELAERLLLATIGHSHSRMRSEHGTWCAASVRAGESNGSCVSPGLLGWAAWWAMIGGDLPCALEWSSRGGSLPTAPGDPGRAVCRAVEAFALWTAGRAADAAGLVAELEASLDGLPPWEAYTAERALFSFSVGDGFELRAERIAAVAGGIGAPSLLASSRFYEATAKLSGARDAVAAAALHQEGIELARTAGAELAECQNLQGLLDAKVATDAPDTAAVCLDAIGRLYELRYWLYLWRVLDGAACTLARAGRLEQAALLLGHLDRVAAPWRTEPRATTRRLVAEAGWSEAETRGATLGRDAAVRLALDALAG